MLLAGSVVRLSSSLNVVQVLHYSEEKIGLSQQIYDYVDQKIRRLDKDLKNFEGDIARERTKLGLGVSTATLPSRGMCCARCHKTAASRETYVNFFTLIMLCSAPFGLRMGSRMY